MKFHSWSKSFDCILICTYFCFEGENRRTFFRSSVSFRLAFFSSSSPSSLPSLFAIAIYSFLICRSDCFPFVKDYLIRFIFLCLWRSFRFVSMNIEMLEWDFCFGINLVVIDIRSLPRRSCRCVCVCVCTSGIITVDEKNAMRCAIERNELGTNDSFRKRYI